MPAGNNIQDLEMMEILFKRLYKPLRAYAFRLVNEMDVAEDIVQDVFFKIWLQRDTIRFEDQAVKSYLFKAVYTHALNALNQRQLHLYSLQSYQESEQLDQYLSSYYTQNSENSLLLKELEREITTCIESLPPQCHKVFILSRTYGLKNREIAEQLGISIKAVEKQISKALSCLKEHLGKKGLISFLLFIVSRGLPF